MKKSIDKYTKEELELLSYKEITHIILEETPNLNTADLFSKITKLLGLTKKAYEDKIGDYYTSLATDKKFIMLEDGSWDLSKRHKSKKVHIDEEEDDDEFEENEDLIDDSMPKEDSYDDIDEDNSYDDADDDLKDLVVIDDDEIDNE